MDIILYWIPGISKTDTPVFSSIEAQEGYFSDAESKVVATGFYPPYFQNSVRLDTDDVDLTTWYPNYASLTFNDKTFYYFITDKKYINENIVEITIELDTIQTYMFDVQFVGAFIDRLSIRRWNNRDMIINRNYIRENLSENSFTKIDSFEYLNINPGDWFYVAKVAGVVGSSADFGSCVTPVSVDIRDDAVTTMSPYIYAFCPLGLMKLQGDATEMLNANDFLKYSPVYVGVCDLYLIPFKPITEFTVNYNVTPPDLTYSTGQFLKTKNLSGDQSYSIITTEDHRITCDILHKDNVLVISRIGTIPTLGDVFDTHKVPAMLDENYVQFVFGDSEYVSEYPLYALDKARVDVNAWVDITSGTRFYNITDSYNKDSRFDNEYGTIVCNPTPLKYDLKNNQWKEYLSGNSAALTGAIISSGVSLVASAGMGIVKPIAGEMSAISSIGKGAKNIAHYITNSINLRNAPDSVKSLGKAHGEMSIQRELIGYRVTYCDDFDDIARYYESNGYRVSIYTTASLFNYNYRYFFDYVKTKEIHVILGDMNTQEDFEGRFNDGLRLWHTDNEGLLKARDYGLELGQVCVRDNLENIFVGG